MKGIALGLSLQTITHLGNSYGSEAGAILGLVENDASLGTRLVNDLPYIRAEVVYACRHEMAMTPYDVLARRTSIALEDRQRGLGVVDEVAALMANSRAGPPSSRKQAMANAYREAMQQPDWPGEKGM